MLKTKSFSIDQIDICVLFPSFLFSVPFDNFLVTLAQNSLIILVDFSKLCVVKFWSLNNFDFSNSDISHWVNGIDFFCNFLFDCFTGEQLQQFCSCGIADLLCDNLVDSSSDLFLLRCQSVVGLLLLTLSFTGEGDHEHSHNVSVEGLAILDGFDQSFSFLDQR